LGVWAVLGASGEVSDICFNKVFNQMTKLVIDTKHLTALEKQGKELLFKPEAEKALADLLTLQEKVNQAVEEAANYILEEGLKISPNFKGIVGENIRAISRAYGPKFIANDKADSKYLKESTRYYVDNGAIEEYFNKHSKLPKGITQNARKVKLTFKCS
jgi:hypothetical protein